MHLFFVESMHLFFLRPPSIWWCEKNGLSSDKSNGMHVFDWLPSSLKWYHVMYNYLTSIKITKIMSNLPGNDDNDYIRMHFSLFHSGSWTFYIPQKCTVAICSDTVPVTVPFSRELTLTFFEIIHVSMAWAWPLFDISKCLCDAMAVVYATADCNGS